MGREIGDADRGKRTVLIVDAETDDPPPPIEDGPGGIDDLPHHLVQPLLAAVHLRRNGDREGPHRYLYGRKWKLGGEAVGCGGVDIGAGRSMDRVTEAVEAAVDPLRRRASAQFPQAGW